MMYNIISGTVCLFYFNYPMFEASTPCNKAERGLVPQSPSFISTITVTL